MICPNCGNELLEGSVFCDICGAKIEINEIDGIRIPKSPSALTAESAQYTVEMPREPEEKPQMPVQKPQVPQQDMQEPQGDNALRPSKKNNNIILIVAVIIGIPIILIIGLSVVGTYLAATARGASDQDKAVAQEQPVQQESPDKDVTIQQSKPEKKKQEKKESEQEPVQIEESDTNTEKETDTNDQKGWFEEQGLSFSDKNDVEISTVVFGSDNKPGEDASIPVTFKLNGITPSDKNGYKDISATFTFDAGRLDEGERPYAWFSAFDRDTGLWLEAAGAKQFDVIVSMDYTEYTYPEYTAKITVTCPEDYDGTVFYCGGQTSDKFETRPVPDLSRSWKIDELDDWEPGGKGHFFFSGSDK